jgi:methylated-DNA-[protein]-cysteine S-methyltransferase
MPQLSFHSPVGEITVSEEDGFLVSVDWGWGQDQQKTPLLIEARNQLIEYFDGQRRAFALQLHLAGTPFQKRVWLEMQSIPYGSVLTYGYVAKKIGSAPRAIGMACRANPIPLIVPCHRIVSASGLGGYSGAGGVFTKQTLLDHEGWGSHN